MYLLDTNACLDFLLAREPEIAPRIERMFGNLAVSSITAAELRVGSRESEKPERDERQVDLFLRGVMVPPFDMRAAEVYGSMVRIVGVRRSNFDRLIAAHCLALGTTLVTKNERHFAVVPGLRIENWTL